MLLILFPLLAFSQDGSLDASFGDGGTVLTDIDGGIDFALSVAQQSDEKLVVAGGVDIDGLHYPSLIRYLPNGDMDNTYGIDGVASNYDMPNRNYSDLLIQSNDKAIAGGTLYISGENEFVLNRFLPNGGLDLTFATNGELIPFPDNETFGDMIQQNDGTLLFAGNILDNGIRKIALKKYLSNGVPDIDYGNNGISITTVGNEYNSAEQVVLLNNGNVAVWAEITNDGTTSQVLLRFFPDGSLDTSYGNNGVAPILLEPGFSINSITPYNDDKIAVLSWFFDQQEEVMQTRISRYLPNGDFDSSFGNNGVINPNSPYFSPREIVVQSNQRLLLYGELTNFFEGGGYTVLKRYHHNGSIDDSFVFAGGTIEIFTSTMILQTDGKIVCLGHTPWYSGPEDLVLERFNNNPLGLPKFEMGNISVYPNPSKGQFNVKSKIPLNGNYQISDVTGKVLQTGDLFGNQIILDISMMQSGIYFFKTQTQTFRLIKN